ncbi:uncharacterized protein LOC119986903 [Tripterygium wilfordii]|uniref:uncharacterized protein LOC119986903 n=1 Tax=Tripterygium wilfordii TaxID=458696 RepID=UPI0018F7EE9A|nr:uncharacterized protein LOC119986903 [Tripterygium wilfordii]
MTGLRPRGNELIEFEPEIELKLRDIRRKQREERDELNKEDIKEDMADQGQPERRLLGDYTAPIVYNAPSCIVLAPATGKFELKIQHIQMLNMFRGDDNNDPYLHVKEFFDLCSTFHYIGISDEQVRLRLFPFSLKDKAKAWLNSLPPRSINTWDELVKKFLLKFFPAQKTNALKREICNFAQNEGEPFYECWDRYNDLFIHYPHHGFNEYEKVQFFYEGLTPQTRQTVDATVGGSLSMKTSAEATKIFETMCLNSQQWDINTEEKVAAPKQRGVYEINSNSILEAEVAKLRHELKLLAGKKEICAMCSSTMHTIEVCPHNPIGQEESAFGIYSQNRAGYNPYSNTYNPGWRDHPNFSWKNQQGQFSKIPQPPQTPEPKQSPIEDVLAQFMQVTQASIQKLEMQIGQLANVMSEKKQGEFPSQSEANPRGREQAKAIKTLRSGKPYDIRDEDPGDNMEVTTAEDTAEKSPSVEARERQPEEPKLAERTSPNTAPEAPLKERVYVPPLPFPQQFQKQKKDRHMLDIMELFKKVHINIPLLDAIKQVPSYAKFLKDICTNKRKFMEHEKVMLSEECSVVLLNKLPPKLKDPGSFTIPCVIGNLQIEKALIDLGASINLMPLSVFQQLGVGKMQPTSISLQLADHSIKFPLRIIEDILIKVDRFLLPADFIILDMEEDRDIPIIMGRPFLATAGTIIDVKKGFLHQKIEIFPSLRDSCT